MEMDTRSEEIKEIVLSDNSRFSYTRKQIEITNILGATVAVLDGYFITDSVGVSYELYKTKEGNWYDLEETNKRVDKSILLELKLRIDQACIVKKQLDNSHFS
jgi:hypothetical protein